MTKIMKKTSYKLELNRATKPRRQVPPCTIPDQSSQLTGYISIVIVFWCSNFCCFAWLLVWGQCDGSLPLLLFMNLFYMMVRLLKYFLFVLLMFTFDLSNVWCFCKFSRLVRKLFKFCSSFKIHFSRFVYILFLFPFCSHFARVLFAFCSRFVYVLFTVCSCFVHVLFLHACW